MTGTADGENWAGGSAPVIGSVVFGDVIQVSNVEGNVTITLARPQYRVEDFARARPMPAVEQVRARPSQLLQARFEAVPFIGRTKILQEDMREWLDDLVPISVRLLYGTGGQGKTRLASELVSKHAPNWSSAQVRTTPVSGAPGRFRVDQGSEGLLVIVDYADRWALPHLRTLLTDLQALAGSASDIPKIRILLVARAIGFWWDALQGYLEDEYAIPAAAMPLDPLGREVSYDELFSAARDRFAQAMGAGDCAEIKPPAAITGPRSEQVLNIHMAALAAVDAHLQGITSPIAQDRVTQYLLRRERRFWKEWHARDEDPLATPPEVMGRAVFVATLAGPLSYSDASAALVRAQVAAARDATSQVVSDHRKCYPPERPETVLEPLYPDRLGEDFVALTVPGWSSSPARAPVANDAYPGGDGVDIIDPWAQVAIDGLLRSPAEDLQERTWTGPAVITLIETASRWPHIATDCLYPILRANPRLAIQAGAGGLAALARLDSADEDLLVVIIDCLPQGGDMDLDIGIAALMQRLTDLRLGHVSDPVERGRICGKLGARLHSAGLFQQALSAYGESIASFRSVFSENSPERTVDLARALSDLSSTQTNLGLREEALAAAEEAVRLFRERQVRTAADSLMPTALSNLGLALFNLGQRAEALRVTEEAVTILQGLADPDRKAAAQLAKSLSNLGAMRSSIGEHRAALAATQEAVEIFRRLAGEDPGAFEGNLALAMNNISLRMWYVGLRDEAVAAAREAVEMGRRLVRTNPALFESDLARSLTNLGNALSRVGRREESLAATREAAEILRHLAVDQPAAYIPLLAAALNNLSIDLHESGQRDEALRAAQDAVSIRRDLIATQHAAFEADLASSLMNYASFLQSAERKQEALAATQEAVQRYRGLADAYPGRYRGELAAGLDHLADDLSGAGRSEEALPAVQEAIDLFEALAQEEPAVFEPELSKALSNLGHLLSILNRPEDALAAMTRAIEIMRELAASDSQMFEPYLATFLSNYGGLMNELGRPQEALTATSQAVEIWRRFTRLEPGVYEHELASHLSSFAEVRAAAREELPEALEALQESAEIYRRLTRNSPLSFAHKLREVNEALARLLSELGRPQEAAAARDEDIAQPSPPA